MPDEQRVIIAGAGPVGLTAALVLGHMGVSVTVFEAGNALSPEFRASTFHPPTLDLLKPYGLADTIVERGLIADRYQIRDRKTGLVAEFDMDVLSEDTGYPFRVQFEQSRYTPLVLEELERYSNVEVCFSSPVHGVTQDDAAVRIVVGEPGAEREVVGSYLIGADGARSEVRRALGLDFPGLTYPARYLVAVTTFDFFGPFPDLAYVNYVSDPTEFFMLLKLPTVWRTLFPVPQSESPEVVLSEGFVQERLRGIYASETPYPVEEATLYSVHQRIAPTFHVGRTLLAGDAAHINNPLGGMGMNSGIHDAIDAARRLVAILAGDADETALTEYAVNRRDIAVSHVRAISHSNATQIGETSPRERNRYQDEMRRTAADPRLAREFLLRSTLIGPLRSTGLIPAGPATDASAEKQEEAQLNGRAG